MSVLRGNTSGSIASVPLNIPCKVTSVILVNVSGSTATVNVYVANNNTGTSYRIFPKDMSITSGTSRERFDNIKLVKNEVILITTSQSLDYSITFAPLLEDE